MGNDNNCYYTDNYKKSFISPLGWLNLPNLNLIRPSVNPQSNTRGQGCTIYHTFHYRSHLHAFKLCTEALAFTFREIYVLFFTLFIHLVCCKRCFSKAQTIEQQQGHGFDFQGMQDLIQCVSCCCCGQMCLSNA